MVLTLDKETKIRPNIHYLDLISGIMSNHGTISNLNIFKDETQMLVRFCHSYPGSNIIFTEKITYNEKHEIIEWIIIVNGNEIIIYDE